MRTTGIALLRASLPGLALLVVGLAGCEPSGEDAHVARRRPVVMAPAVPGTTRASVVKGGGSGHPDPSPSVPPDMVPVFFTEYARFLAKYVTEISPGVTGLRYAAAAQDRGDLDAFLEKLATTDPATLPDDPVKLSFWINAYNAFAIQAILDHYPVDSIRDLSTTIPPEAIWDKKWFTVNGTKVSLNHVEHKVLRKQFQEPRIHVAIVCASTSCPNLQPWVFVPDRLEVQLDAAMRQFLADEEKGARLVAEAQALRVSAIFKWFARDFEAGAGSVLAYITPFLPDEARRHVEEHEVQLGFLPYDWSLNEAESSAPDPR